MTSKQRVMIRSNRERKINFGIKAFDMGLINNKSYIKRVIDKLMELYADGKLDAHFSGYKMLTNAKDGADSPTQVSRDIKSRMENRAFKQKLIPHPCHGAWVIEILMEKFIEGKFDDKMKESYG